MINQHFFGGDMTACSARAALPAATQRSALTDRPDPVPTLEKPKILVVNDDAASLFALTSLLNQWAEQESYEVLSARSGQDALRQVLRHDFAVILLDVNMPGMDGFETAEAIHQRTRSANIPIIFITAFLTDELDRLRAYQRGAVDFLFTPVIPQVLHAKIAVFVALAMKNEELKRQARQLSQRSTELTGTNKRLTREIEERKTAERQNHAKDEFLAMLGHELRNPLSAISSAATLIGLPGVAPDSAARARQIIVRQSQHLGRIVDDLLDLSRAMSGKILLSRTPMDLAALVTACLETCRATGRSAGYALHQQLEPGWVDGDATRLEQIVSNLLDNALKYTPPGGRIDVRTAADGDDVVLTVRDTGVGIAPDLLPQVFDVFVQGSSTLDRAQGGLGIGLSLVRRLAELHGGRVRADSGGDGAGSTFTLRLPRIAHGLPAAPAPPSHALADKPSVLLIEDNDDGREMMAMMLSCYGYRVQQAADGSQGLQLAARCRPDLALIDIGLPGMDGYEVARRLRAEQATHDIKLVALTGYGQAEDRQRVLDAGFDRHLVKPVDVEQLLQVIGHCMGQAVD
jgi:two-component system, sensor histidine kinase